MSTAPPKKPKKDAPAITAAQLEQCKSIMTALFNEKDGKRSISYDFRALPDRVDWADYYEIIPEPRCLDDINSTLVAGRFNSVQAFLKDLQLVFRNAMYYNEEGSPIAHDAQKLNHLVLSLAASKGLPGLPSSSSAPPPPASPGPFVPPPQSSSSTAGPLLPPVASSSTGPSLASLNANGGVPKKRGRPSNADLAARLAAQIAAGNFSPEEAAAMREAVYAPKPKKPKPTPGAPIESAGAKSKPKPSASASPAVAAPARLPSLPPPPLHYLPQQPQVPPPISQQQQQLDLLAQLSPSYLSEPTPAPMDLLPMDFGSPAGGYYPSGFSDSGGPSTGMGGAGGGGNISDDQDEKLVGSKDVAQMLDSGLQKLEGFEEVGWMEEDGDGGAEGRVERCEMILNGVKGFRDATGYRLADVLDRIPEATDNDFLTFDWPLSLAGIEHQVAHSVYTSIVDFDKDMARLFEKARRFFLEGSKEYGDVLVLQRLYQTLSSPNPISTTAATNFASLTAGPGNARPLKTGETPNGDPLVVTSLRLNTKDRDFLSSAYYKGVTYSPGEYLHLSNPDDPAKPIIGHIFKVFVPKGSDKVGLSVCWYFRPEQTIHPADRTFYEHEVFKTAQFADHVLEDIIEKIGCQFYTKAIRGRPKPPGWYRGWPLYVCDSRWNDKDKTMIRIKNWNSCIPDELRKTDFMAVYPFESVIKIRRVVSPFIRGVTGPGSIGEAGTVRTGGGGGAADDGDEGGAEEQAQAAPAPIPLTAEQKEEIRRAKRIEEQQRLNAMVFPNGLPTANNASPSSSISVAPRSYLPPPPPSALPSVASGSSTPLPITSTTATPTGSHSALPSTPSYHQQPARPAAPPPQQQPLTAAQIAALTAAASAEISAASAKANAAYQQQQAQQQQQQVYRGTPNGGAGGSQTPVQQQQRPVQQQQYQQNGRGGGPQRGRLMADRTVVGNSGGAGWVGQVANFDTVGEETAGLFERDPSTNKLLWFSAPPSTIPVLPKPKHSLAYLAFLANKKHAQPQQTSEELIPELREAFEHGVLNPRAEVLLEKRFGRGGELEGLDFEAAIRDLEQEQQEMEMDGVMVVE